MQKQSAKWNLRERLGKKNLDSKSQPWRKVNGQSQRFGQRPGQRWHQLTVEWRQQMTWQWWLHLGLTSAGENLARGGACRRVTARDEAWRRVTVRGACELLSRIFWRRVRALMMVRFPWEGRSAEEDLSGTYKNTIGARITMATVWQWSRDSEWRQL